MIQVQGGVAKNSSSSFIITCYSFTTWLSQYVQFESTRMPFIDCLCGLAHSLIIPWIPIWI